MSDKTSIEWTDATWNPIVGCSVVSPGCTNCYAMRQAARIELMDLGRRAKRGDNLAVGGTSYAGLTQPSKSGPVWTGKVALASDETLTQPLRWKRGRRIFVNSMGDLFHESVPDEWIDRVFAAMALAPQHTFQVLTKRTKRMRSYLTESRSMMSWAIQAQALKRAQFSVFSVRDVGVWRRSGLPNVHLGVSAEDQPRADERIPELLATPGAVRFVSGEPLLGEINFESVLNPASGNHLDVLHRSTLHGPNYGERPRLDWIIVGGESGKGARPMHPDWARSIRDQCAAAGVPFFFKQWGEWAPGENVERGGTLDVAYNLYADDDWSFGRLSERESEQTHIDNEPTVYRVGKARACRRLDGVEHNAFPEPRR